MSAPRTLPRLLDIHIHLTSEQHPGRVKEYTVHGSGYNEDSHYAPIPLNAGEVNGWKSIAIEQTTEALVPLGAYATEAGAILTSSVYYGEHNSSPYTGNHRLEGSLLSVFVRERVARRLLEAQQLLPEGYHLLVFDAYRPLQVQRSLFHFYRDQLHLQRPDMSEDELNGETQKYVSIPSSDATRPSPHNTGGAVDLAIVKLPRAQSAVLKRIDNRLANRRLNLEDRTALEAQKGAIVRQHAAMLDFGTPFDHGGGRAAIAYFERRLARGFPLSPKETEARDNRRLLYAVMTQVGMQAYADEWWHYNAPESQMGAAAAGLAKATYGAAIFDVWNNAHERLRHRIYYEGIRLQEEIMSAGTSNSQSTLNAKMSTVLLGAGDPRIVTKSWPAEVIGPQKGPA